MIYVWASVSWLVLMALWIAAATISLRRALLGLRTILSHLRHPARSLDDWWCNRIKRLDRNISNFCALIGLMLPSLSIILQGPVPNSALHDMPDSLQVAMCMAIVGGCAIKVHGVLSGSRFYCPRTPLKRSYQYGYQGAPMATAGLFVYGYFLVENTPTWLSALGVVLAPMLGIGIGLQACAYWLEVRCMEREEVIEHVVRQRLRDE